ncbi:hypothetical protein [Caballeronia sp. LZ001]|uniref:hypothetical protein n=1 Tax=Caballeronia sp. LZ001 TaxID=3038553 RepID=UPI00285EAB3F|nr:hypothetical protein [Caballeronia sp. LZ001]MDR5803418.1 hypothetical protein [Caballeronia sp. LZ001]
MQVTLDTQVILGTLVTMLLGIIEAVGLLWIRSVQSRMKEAFQYSQKLQADIATFREAIARDYVPRDEQRHFREEYRSTLQSIDMKLSDINNKLDRKQDKQ